MTTAARTTSHGITFAGALAVAFIVLRLCHVIAWPWLWVLAPLWMPWAIAAVCVLALLVVIGLALAFRGMFPRKPRGNPYAGVQR